MAGDQVIAVARRESDALAAAIREVSDHGTGKLHFRPFDLNDVAALPGLVKELRLQYGALNALVIMRASAPAGCSRSCRTR